MTILEIAWTKILALLIINCVALSKLFNVFASWFHTCKMGKNNTYLIGLGELTSLIFRIASDIG